MMTQLVLHHHHLHQSLRIFKILRTHMNCKQRRQELDSWQNAKSSRKDPARDKWPLAKLKGIYCNKVCCFAGLVKSVGKIIADKLLWNYRTSTQQKQRTNSTYGKAFNNKTLFATVLRQSTIHATVPMAKFSTNAATFGKSRIQLSQEDNQLSRQDASPFTNFKIQ